jgi:hypothetical protein
MDEPVAIAVVAMVLNPSKHPSNNGVARMAIPSPRRMPIGLIVPETTYRYQCQPQEPC